MNVFLLSEIHRPEPGRVRPYPDASHPRSGERERIIRSQNPMSTLFQKNFSHPLFSVFPNIFHHFHSPPSPAPKLFSPSRPPSPPPFLHSSRPSATPALPIISIFSIKSTISSTPCAPFSPFRKNHECNRMQSIAVECNRSFQAARLHYACGCREAPHHRPLFSRAPAFRNPKSKSKPIPHIMRLQEGGASAILFARTYNTTVAR